MAQDTEYVKLPGRRGRLFGGDRVWLGERHLLMVRNFGYLERYSRVELADIQAFVLRGTQGLVVWAAILGASLLLLASLALVTSDGWRLGWLICAAALAGILAIHLLRGPTCEVQLRTPVQLLAVPAWNRWRVAEESIARLRPRLVEFQGEVEVADLRQHLGELAPLPHDAKPAATVSPSSAKRPRPPYGGRWHTVLAYSFLVDGLVTSWQLTWPGTLADFVGVLVFLILVGCTIAALVRQVGSSLLPGLRRWAWWSLVYLCVLAMVALVWGSVAGVISALEGDLLAGDQLVGFRALSAVNLGVSLLLFALWVPLEWRRRSLAAVRTP